MTATFCPPADDAWIDEHREPLTLPLPALAGRGYLGQARSKRSPAAPAGRRRRPRRTLMDENISRPAGASHGQGLTERELQTIVAGAGRSLRQRTTLYGKVAGQSQMTA